LRLTVERIALRKIHDRGTSRAHITHIKGQFAEVMEAMRRAATLKDRLAFCQSDLAFHHRIVDLAQSPVLTPTWQLLSRGVFVFLMQQADSFNDFERLIAEHELLLGMLLGGRKEELDKAIEDHIFWDLNLLREAERVDDGAHADASHADAPHALAAKPP
jgi:DNA-binding GntR family transcriptional regulator